MLDFVVEDGAVIGCNRQSTMEDQPENGELRETSELAILQGKRLFDESGSLRVRLSSAAPINGV